MSLTFKIIDAGSADRSVVAFQVIDPASVDRTIVEGRIIGPDGHDRVFYDTTGASSFAVSSTPDLVVGTSYLTGTATTNSTTATATGGTAPYTYAWTRISYTHPTTAPTIGSAAAATTIFTQTNIGAGQDFSALFRVTATDSAVPPNTATFDVDATFSDTA